MIEIHNSNFQQLHPVVRQNPCASVGGAPFEAGLNFRVAIYHTRVTGVASWS